MARLGIDVETWNALNRLLDEALDLPPADRQAWIDDLDRSYDSLKPRLRDLLTRLEQGGTSDLFGTLPKLEQLASGDSRGEAEGTVEAGATVGPYRLVRELGTGGMGTVWLAERRDGLLNRPVALKLPRGTWWRRDLAERLAREREILATLDHPNIARIYDAGVTADRQPYLALEYVEGRALDAYCAQQAVDLRGRLALFLRIASAVAHAHGRLVVHRDLKPSNILVTGEGQVRLLDFGIAKLLEEGSAGPSDLTEIGGRVLTPGYASPEQIAGAPIGTASDVYSLGVVLYELLTGRRPHAQAGRSARALEQAVLDDEPERPSDVVGEPAVRRSLGGDLDTIVLKALKKAPGERYASVDAFADDIERYLDGRPVLARPDSRWYRLSKFVGRHRLGVGAAAAALVAILGGAGTAVWQAQVARAEQQRAEEVKEFIASVFAGADPYRGGGTSVRAVDLLRQAEARIDQIASEYPETRIELLTIIGSSLLLLQDTAAAESSVMRAAEEGRMQLGAEHPLTLDARLLSTQVHRFRGRTAEMRAELDALVPIFRQRPDRVEDLVNALQYRSHAALDDGRYEEAERAATEGLTLAEARLGRRHSATVQLAMSLAQTYQYGRPRPEQALEASERAMRLVSDLHADPTYPRVVDMRHIYARALGGAGEYGRGIDELERAIRDAEAAVGPEGRKVAFMRSNLARIQRRAGQLEAAIRNATASSAILARDFAPDSWSYAGGIVSRGIIYLTARRADDAWIDLDRASTGLAKTMGPDHVQVFIARYYLQLARAYRGQVADAESTLRQLIAGFRSDDPSDRAVFGPPLHALGIIERLAGRFDAALATQREALGKFDEGVAGALDRLHVRTEIGLNQVALGRPAEAVETLRPAVADFTAIQIAPTPQRADALVGLGCAYLELGRPADAVPILEEADAFWRSFDAGNRWAGEAALWLGRAYAAVGRQAKARAASSRAVLILSRSPLPLDAALVRLAQR